MQTHWSAGLQESDNSVAVDLNGAAAHVRQHLHKQKHICRLLASWVTSWMIKHSGHFPDMQIVNKYNQPEQQTS